jgi:hypothetical protein
VPLALHRDLSSSNLSLPRDSSSTSISSMRKDLSSGSIGSIELSADAHQQQPQSAAEGSRMRALSGSNFSQVAKTSPSGALGSNRKGVSSSGAGGGAGSGDHDAYDACVFALGGGASRMQCHIAANMHRFSKHTTTHFKYFSCLNMFAALAAATT